MTDDDGLPHIQPLSRQMVMSHRWRCFAAIPALLASFSTMAFEPLTGQFLARLDCPATVGIGRAPDGVSVRAGAAYPVLGLNRREGDYLQIRVPGTLPAGRWVRLSCGEWRAEPGGAEALASGQKPQKLVLSLSWQPAFCESKPDLQECRTQTPSRFDADHFSLHGLWPQPRSLEYCGVAKEHRSLDERRRWDALPPVKLQADTARQLGQVMPGIVSGLERHEWVRHGSCFGADAETYYRTALALLGQVNRSKLREVLAGRLGEAVTVGQLKDEFEASFGRGSGQALGIRCTRDGNRELISEIRIKLKSPVSDTTPLRDALDLGSPAAGNCEAGVVDRVGLD